MKRHNDGLDELRESKTFAIHWRMQVPFSASSKVRRKSSQAVGRVADNSEEQLEVIKERYQDLSDYLVQQGP